MLKPQDLLVVLKFAAMRDAGPITFAGLAASISMSASEVFAAVRRATECHLLAVRRHASGGAAQYRPLGASLREFLTSGVRYVFPAEPGKVTRGFRTAQDAPPLDSRVIRPPDELPWVWPHPEGNTRGHSIQPIYRSAPDASRHDDLLYRWLALTDALRAGDARVRSLAAEQVNQLVAEFDNARTR